MEDATGGAALANGHYWGVCWYVGTSRFGWSPDIKGRGKQSVCQTGLNVKKAKEGPRDRCPGPSPATRGTHHTSTFQGTRAGLHFSRRLSSPLLFFLKKKNILTARAPFCCAFLPDMSEDREMNHLISFHRLKNLSLLCWMLPFLATRHFGAFLASFHCLHFFLRLRASVPRNTPVRYVHRC